MHRRSFQSGLLALLATAGLLAGVSEAGAAQLSAGVESASPRASTSAAYPKYYLNTVVTQWTHYAPDYLNSSHVGTLYAGRSYFYCYTYSSYTYTNNGHTSPVYLLTDDDTGNPRVWVSDVNLDEWGWENDLNVLPHC